MAKDPAFLFYDGDAARDVSHMNRLERGAYFDLIQAQRKFGGLTVEQIRKVLGKDFEEVWPALELILFKTETDKFYIEWVQISIENRKQFTEKQRKRIQDYWDDKKKNNDSNNIPRNNDGITTDIPLENENEIVNESIISNLPIEEKIKTWREDFLIYQDELRKAWKEIITAKYIAEREKYHPKLDIKLTLEKSCIDFWNTEAGWKNKKASRSKEIDWKRTFNNALTQKQNQVWKTNQYSNIV